MTLQAAKTPDQWFTRKNLHGFFLNITVKICENWLTFAEVIVQNKSRLYFLETRCTVHA